MYIKIRVQWTSNDIHNDHTNNIKIIRINLQNTSDRDVASPFF